MSLLRSGNRPKSQQWKPDESTEVEETSTGKDQDWNDDSDSDWTFDSESRSSLPGGSVCAIVASDGRVSSRRSNTETDSLVPDEEASQTFMCWQVDLAVSCSPVVDDSLLANVCDLGWDTEQHLSELSIAGFREVRVEDVRSVPEGVRSSTLSIASRCIPWCGRRVSCPL